MDFWLVLILIAALALNFLVIKRDIHGVRNYLKPEEHQATPKWRRVLIYIILSAFAASTYFSSGTPRNTTEFFIEAGVILALIGIVENLIKQK